MNIHEMNQICYRAMMTIFNQKGFAINGVTAQQGPRVLSYQLRLSDSLQLKQVCQTSESIALQCGVRDVLMYRNAGYLITDFTLPPKLWKKYYLGELGDPLGIGMGLDKKPVTLSFDDAPHFLYCGTTNSGKSWAVMSSLIALFKKYSPDELNAIILDPHNDLERFENSSHVIKFDFGSIATTPEQIKQAFDYGYRIFDNRVQNNIKDDKRLLIVMDEPEKILIDKEILSRSVRIGNEGRKFNINLMVTAKKAIERNMPGLIQSLGNRFVGKQEIAKNTIAMITGDSSIDCRKLSNHGDFLHCVNGDITRFVTTYLRNQDFESIQRGGQSVVELDDSPIEQTIREDRRFRQYDSQLIAYQMMFGHLKHGPLTRRQLADKYKMAHATIDNHNEFAQSIALHLRFLLDEYYNRKGRLIQ